MDFLFPAGLWLFALSAPLAALYFLKLRRRKIRVSSLLPWHALQRSEKLASPFQRFRRNLLLLLQLLLLLLLALALARPYLETESAQFRSVILVLDTSASMNATDVAPSRFEHARQQATSIVRELGPVDEVMVVLAGPRTEVLVPFTRDGALAEVALGKVQATEAEGGIEEALELALSLARTRPDIEVVALTDGGPRDLSSIATGDVTVRYAPIGSKDTNGGIVALDLRRSTVSEADRQLFVTTRWFGSAPVDGTVEVYLDRELVALRTARLDPELPVSMVFELPAAATGVLRVHLDAPGDVLEADNEAWAVLSPLGAREVLLVGGDALLARILASDVRIRARQVAPGDVTPEMLASADCVLFSGAVPDGVDGLHYAVLGPFPGSPVRFGDAVRAPRVTGWQRTHALLRFTRWDDVFFGEARTVVDAAGLAPVVDAEHGPLILAGQRHGGRVVQLSFDPLASDLPLRVAWPVWVLNTVGWLTEDRPAGGEAATIRTGAPYSVRLSAGATAASATGPDGAVAVVVADDLLRLPDTDQVGVYTVTSGTTVERFAANLLSEAESRVRPRSALGLTSAHPTETSGGEISMGRRELWRPLLLVALALLALEWGVWNLRRVA